MTLRNLTRAFALMILVAGLSNTVLAVDPPGVPELDPGSMGSALALVGGALLILRGRRNAG